MGMTGYGKITDWFIPYSGTRYQGYIEDLQGRKIHVPENEALSTCNLLNGLTEALADIADRFDTYEDADAKSLCEYAYDLLYGLGHIVPDAQGRPHQIKG